MKIDLSPKPGSSVRYSGIVQGKVYGTSISGPFYLAIEAGELVNLSTGVVIDGLEDFDDALYFFPDATLVPGGPA